MNFQFYKTDKTLTQTTALGGCGLTALQANQITTEQSEDGYEFCYHTGYHGTGQSHYVYIRESGSTQIKGCSRIFINGTKAYQCENDGKLKKKLVKDAIAVVRANQALFLQIAQNQ